MILLLVGAEAAADAPRPSLDDFYERTRERDDGFTECVGYCDGEHLAALMIGAETANPSTDALRPQLATGLRLGGDFGIHDGRDVARSQLWADVLRVNDTGQWLDEFGWHTTGFKAFGRDKDDTGLHLSLDSVLAHRTELQPSDVAELQAKPYTLADVELEAAPIGPMIDKEGHIALPIGVANRLRWSDGMTLERRTAVSVAIVDRAYPKGITHHAQLDFLRVKYTDWSAGMTRANQWTISTGYQHLPYGIDTLPIWTLVGYEWAGDRRGVVAQIGGAFRFTEARLEIGPEYNRHFELDPRTGMFERVQSAKLGFVHHVGPVRWGVAYEAIGIEGGGSLQTLTPELGVDVFGLVLGARYRFAWTSDVDFPGQRFNVSLDLPL